MNSDPSVTTQQGLRLARGAGLALGVILLTLAIIALATGTSGFYSFKAVYFMLYGLVLLLPYAKLREKDWRWSYAVLVLLSFGFVFVMIVSVMFAYMAAAEQGERLGVPGLEGSLIFLALMQVPVVLFQRRPDLID